MTDLTKNLPVWLAFEDAEQREHHMRWVGHPDKESAKKELNFIIQSIVSNGGKIPNTYIYSSETVAPGHIEEEFDLGEFEKVFDDLQKA